MIIYFTLHLNKNVLSEKFLIAVLFLKRIFLMLNIIFLFLKKIILRIIYFGILWLFKWSKLFSVFSFSNYIKIIWMARQPQVLWNFFLNFSLSCHMSTIDKLSVYYVVSSVRFQDLKDFYFLFLCLFSIIIPIRKLKVLLSNTTFLQNICG